MEENFYLEQEIEDIKNLQRYGYKEGSFEQLSDNLFKICLFEGTELIIKVSIAGFEIEKSDKLDLKGKIFETMEALLSETSPMYREKFSSLLFDHLVGKIN